MSNKPMITAFLEAYKAQKPITNNADEAHEYLFNGDFIENYIKEHINTEDKMKQIIVEYGFKKLIDDMVEIGDEEVCEDLFQPMKVESIWISWLSTMLSNLAYEHV
jgi:hypothetical protein